MARIAYILLCHKDPKSVIAQARMLTAAGDFMSIHYDANAKDSEFQTIKDALADNDRVIFAKRVKCGWGEYSLIAATLNAVKSAETAFARASHFYLLSGDCMAIKSATYMRAWLDANDMDYIESFDFFDSDWIKTGMRGERLTYRHFFNERRHKTLFYLSLEWQKKLGLERSIPSDLQVMIGSQWWCLRRRTIELILAFVRARRDVTRFFSTTWIPDETFFQTLVRHLVPGPEIDSRILTYKMFSDYGMPVSFFNDQYDLLVGQRFFFARKISPDALGLKEKLGALYAGGQTKFPISDEGPELYHYLTNRGRTGGRFKQRFWESGGHVGAGRELLIIVCKKWQLAGALRAAISKATGITGVDYIFDDDHVELPKMGGLENSREKRTRHRRATMRLVFDYFDTDRLLICTDPSGLELINDFHADGSSVRVLEVECSFDDEYLAGHAMRKGLIGDNSSDNILNSVLPTLIRDFDRETTALRAAGFPLYFRLGACQNLRQRTSVLAAFLDITVTSARKIQAVEDIFAE